MLYQTGDVEVLNFSEAIGCAAKMEKTAGRCKPTFLTVQKHSNSTDEDIAHGFLPLVGVVIDQPAEANNTNKCQGNLL